MMVRYLSMNPCSPTGKRAMPDGHTGIPDRGKGHAAKTNFHHSPSNLV